MSVQEKRPSVIGLLTGRETSVRLPDNLRLSVFNSSRAPRAYMREAQRSARVAISKARELIPIRDCYIHLFLDGPRKNIEDPDPHVGGSARADGVFAQIYSLSPKFTEKHDICTQGVIAHELHHVARMRGPGIGETLLHLLVAEGLAMSFAEDYFGHTGVRTHPQLKGITEQKIQLYWEIVKDEVFADKQKIYYQNWTGPFVPGKGLPSSIGYLLGYYFVRSYLRAHPNETSASLAQTPVERFIESAAFRLPVNNPCSSMKLEHLPDTN